MHTFQFALLYVCLMLLWTTETTAYAYLPALVCTVQAASCCLNFRQQQLAFLSSKCRRAVCHSTVHVGGQVAAALIMLCRFHAPSPRRGSSSPRACGRSVSNGVLLCCIGFPHTLPAHKGGRPSLCQGWSSCCRGVLRNSCAASGDHAAFNIIFADTPS